MPERNISQEEFENIRSWVYHTKKGEMVENFTPGQEDGLWVVDDHEPIAVVTSFMRNIDQHNHFLRYEATGKTLYCSEKHMRELEDQSILNKRMSVTAIASF